MRQKLQFRQALKESSSRREEAYSSRRQMKEDPKSDHASMARVQIHRERRKRRSDHLASVDLIFDECWVGLRADRRLQEMLDKIGFTKVMRNGKN